MFKCTAFKCTTGEIDKIDAGSFELDAKVFAVIRRCALIENLDDMDSFRHRDLYSHLRSETLLN